MTATDAGTRDLPGIRPPGASNPGGSSPRLLAAGAIGNVLEWYDFASYGFLAPIFARTFFPAEDALVGLISAFGLFGAAFLMRPLGAVLFGHVGDRFGPRIALIVSVSVMSCATVGIGLLPTYATAGFLAPLLLLILRLVQGLSIGGEYTTSSIYLAEHAVPRHRGLTAAFSTAGGQTGTLIGSGVCALLSALLSAEAMQAFGWRVPFLLGAVLGITALVLRRPRPGDRGGSKARGLPLTRAFREAGGSIIAAMLVTLFIGADTYLLFVYLPTYIEQEAGLAPATALAFTTLGLIVSGTCCLLFAALSDRIGRRRIVAAGLAGFVVLSWPLFLLLRGGSPAEVLAAQLVFSVMAAAVTSPMPALLVELFETPVRCSAIGFAWNLGIGVSGGLAPMLATYFVTGLGLTMAPAVHLMLLAAVALVGVASLTERRGRVLDGPSDWP